VAGSLFVSAPAQGLAIVGTWSVLRYIVDGVVMPSRAELASCGRVTGHDPTAALAMVAVGLGSPIRAAAGKLHRWCCRARARRIKVIAETFAQSRRATLFIAPALYGGVLIAVPRIGSAIKRPSGLSLSLRVVLVLSYCPGSTAM
jgi:hypothetical protein